MKELENLQHSFFKEILALRSQYVNLRYEIRSLMGHSKPDPKMVVEKQKKFSDIQNKIDEISIQHLLKARALFTPNQLSRLPSGCNLGGNYGFGAGRERIHTRGKRY